jgi:hypothetical protein
MSYQQPKRTETEDVSRVESLLGLLRNLSHRDPSPALRERLSDLASQRLKVKPESGPQVRGTIQRARVWSGPIFVTALVIAIVLTMAFVARLQHREPLRIDNAAKINPPATAPVNNIHTPPATKPSRATLPKTHQSRPEAVRRARPQQMTMRLPYSNSAIDTGTDATIRISISQSELLSLGFPVSATLRDHRVVAQLTLGDDGLPRAISLPLPLEVVKEKK